MIKQHEKNFLEFLSLKSSYDYDPEFVEVVQTHISIVAIAPPFVYKIKKNVKLDFLDYSSLEKRKFFLEREIELNRRLCDNVYLEIVPIYEFEGLLSFEKFFHGSGRIYDYALKMNYLKPEFCLVNILKNHAFSGQMMDLLIEKLGKFYLSQKSEHLKPEITENGKPEAIWQMFQQNLAELQKVSSAILPTHILNRLADFSTLFFNRFKNDFNERYVSGSIKDGHGDLRLEHVYIQKNQVSIYDCIEFNDSFRHVDILNDLAFFLMELDFYGYGEISTQFRKKCISYFKIAQGESILTFYKIHRALVRAKVNCIVSREDEMPFEKRDLAVKNAERFLSLAVRYALTLDQPAVFVIMGKTASGKSTVAKRLSLDSGIQVLSTDVVRKQMAKIDVHKETPDELKPIVYSSDFTEKVYENLLSNVEKNLARDGSVILDGTFSKEKYRRLLQKLVQKKFSNARLLFVEAHTADSEKIKRLKQREVSGGISDARVFDKKTIDTLYEAPDEIPESIKIIVNNQGDLNDVMENIYEKIFQSLAA
jgi:hypothetical protein